MTEKKFLYLVQSDNCKKSYPELRSSSSCDVIYLNWKDNEEGTIFVPMSTWTQGRNNLRMAAIERGRSYEYYIFLDDDVVFETGNFAEFENHLLKYRPAIATPLLRGFEYNTDYKMKVQTICLWDPCMNAFHRSVFEDNVVLPYRANFDGISWWYSGYISIVLANYFYPFSIVQFNDIVVWNSKSRPYPRTWYLSRIDTLIVTILLWLKRPVYPKYIYKRVDSWIYSSVLKRGKRAKSVRRVIKSLKSSPFEIGKASYTISDAEKAEFLRSEFLTSEMF